MTLQERQKYKQYCGLIMMADPPPSTLPPEAERAIRLQMQRHEASEHRRRLMQGLGRKARPIRDQAYAARRRARARWSGAGKRGATNFS
jgi:hypothetical protein